MRNHHVLFPCAGLLLLALAVPSLAARGYESYYDLLDAAPWYDGAKSTIDYQPTPVDGIAIAAWCGIDNGGVDAPMQWVQGGWDQFKDGAPHVYWEYTDKNNQYRIGWDGAPNAADTYEQSRNGGQMEWRRGGVVYKTADWSLFNTIELRKAQYGAEMHDTPADHTPGVAARKNNFLTTQVRRSLGAYASAPLAIEVSTAEDGNLEPVGVPGNGSFRTWDNRDH
ncbi:MAG: hypothetical protein JO171_15920 [Paludibacterium sp.]|uniref:hypothetical protein n=1 Tax=Paludibacterium sp. TaxID=1917523 RepID=UPI0025D39FAD|nr:hypothetical protein [Paludibacterium sp.]MBV8048636.1 hypothetical protein [Paludibacterium sp.]